MSVSAETYIVISLMFAVFAAFAAVGTSVVLGAGFERLRAGFEVVRRQSGFFADAIYKLDERTQKLDAETQKLKAGLAGMDGRMERAEKTATFLADSITSIEHRILQGGAAQPPVRDDHVLQSEVVADPMPRRMAVTSEPVQWVRVPAPEQSLVRDEETISPGLFRDYPEEMPRRDNECTVEPPGLTEESGGLQDGLTTLLSRYFLGEASGSGKGVVYH